MLNKLLANKKTLVIAIALVVAVCIGVVMLINPSSKETGGKDRDTKTEHDKKYNKVNEEDDSDLEVLKPDQTTPGNSSDAFGSWDDEPEANTHNPSSKEPGGKDADSKSEHGNENNKVNEEDGNTSLEVLKPDQTTPENSSDASGSWNDDPEANTQTDHNNTTDKTDEQTPSDESNQTENEGSDENPEKDEDILEDDITWGDIY